MSQESRPKLNLGEPPGRLKQPFAGGLRWWIAVVITLQLVILVVLTAALWRLRHGDARGAAVSADSDAGQWKSLALELENRSLDGAAADAWEKYLAAAASAEDRAEVAYRIGKLCVQAEQYERAAAALVRCEQLAGEDSELSDKVGPLLITCLRRLGRYGEVGRELSRRVEAGAEGTEKGRVLATLAGQSLTEADLDRMIERRVDQMLAMQDATGDEALRRQVLERFSQPAMRQQLFQEMLQTELFTRRARELQLDRDEEFQQAREALESGLLANRFLARELDKIQPTEVDLQAYYQLNQNAYRQPETAQVLIEELAADDDAAALLNEVQTADDFRNWLRKRRSADRPDEDEVDLPPVTLVRGRPDPRLGDTEAVFELEAGHWTAEPIVNRDRRFLVLVDKKTPARTLPLDEVRQQVRSDYVARKREELSRRLFGDLMQRYEVVIQPLEADATSPPGAPPSNTSQTPSP